MNAGQQTRSLAVVDTYVDALLGGAVDKVLATLDPAAEFVSPFNVWRGEQLRSVYTARSEAFGSLTMDTLIRERDRAVILWHAAVKNVDNGQTGRLQTDESQADEAHAAEVLWIRDGAIRLINVYLRPAIMLNAVHEAMAASWPSADT
jgi:hypothetical protein